MNEEIQARARTLMVAFDQGVITSEECQDELARLDIEWRENDVVGDCTMGLDAAGDSGDRVRVPGSDHPIPLEEALEVLKRICQGDPHSALNVNQKKGGKRDIQPSDQCAKLRSGI